MYNSNGRANIVAAHSNSGQHSPAVPVLAVDDAHHRLRPRHRLHRQAVAAAQELNLLLQHRVVGPPEALPAVAAGIGGKAANERPQWRGQELGGGLVAAGLPLVQATAQARGSHVAAQSAGAPHSHSFPLKQVHGQRHSNPFPCKPAGLAKLAQPAPSWPSRICRPPTARPRRGAQFRPPPPAPPS